MKKALKAIFTAVSVIGTAQTIYSLVPEKTKEKLTGLLNKAAAKVTGKKEEAPKTPAASKKKTPTMTAKKKPAAKKK